MSHFRLNCTKKPGRPAYVISQVVINLVERLGLNDCGIKVAELASECCISNGSVYTIIHEHFGIVLDCIDS